MNDDVKISRESWCSWCGTFSKHTLHIERAVGRSTYKCENCEYLTIKCRFCENMARAGCVREVPKECAEDEIANTSEISASGEEALPEPIEKADKEISRIARGRQAFRKAVGSSSEKVSDYFTEKWDNELCAEHDGSIPDFAKAHARIKELGEFEKLMEPKRKGVYGKTKQAAMVATGMAAIGTGAWVAAPGIAAALGAGGLLGAAGTGTAISSLSGAALTSASVAKLGVGGMAVVSAVGAGLGGKAGYGLATSYMKDIPDYEFVKKREKDSDSSHQIVVVNGFLTESDKDGSDWSQGLKDYSEESPIWYLNWEAKTLLKLGNSIFTNGAEAFTRNALVGGASKASKFAGKAIARGGVVLGAANLAANPWHSAMVNAEKAGLLLAEAISRSEGKTYTLMGHSLGARVVFFALLALATKEGEKFVDKAVLMGGAVGRDVEEDWNRAADAVNGYIFNCHTERDSVLKLMYQFANLGLSVPAGLGPAEGSPRKIVNIDFSSEEEISGHNAWKQNLPVVLSKLEQ